jgi:uncharacterized membrane protein
LVVVVGRTVVVVVVGGGVVVVVVGATVVVVVVVVVVVALAEVLTGEAFEARSTPVEHAAISPATPTAASASTILFTRTDLSPANPGYNADHQQRRDTVCGGCDEISVS